MLATIMLDGNIVRNKIIRTNQDLDQEIMLKLNILLNGSLNGLSLEQINLVTIAKLKEQAGIHSEVVSSVLDAVAEAMQEDEEFGDLHQRGDEYFQVSGAFRFPEGQRPDQRF